MYFLSVKKDLIFLPIILAKFFHTIFSYYLLLWLKLGKHDFPLPFPPNVYTLAD